MSFSVIVLIIASVIGIIVNVKKKEAEVQKKRLQNIPHNQSFEELINSLREEQESINMATEKMRSTSGMAEQVFEEASPSTMDTNVSDSTIKHEALEGFEEKKEGRAQDAAYEIDVRKLIIYSELMKPKWEEI